MDNSPILKLEIGMQDKYKPIQEGFTLIEILVVILIIGITVGFAMFAFGDFGRERKLVASAENLSHFLELVHEKALLESSTLQVVINNTGYETTRLTITNQWQTLSSSFYHQHSFPNTLQMTIGHAIKHNNQVHITFDASGNMSPFLLFFGSTEHPKLVSIQGQNDGTIAFKKEGHP